ncbi:MAG: GerMN domain-containing protein [Geitlerinemataceae cyanobacterium]
MTSDLPTPQPNRDRSARLAAIVCSLLVAGGAVASYALWQRVALDGMPEAAPSRSEPGSAENAPDAAEDTATVYWLSDTDDRLELVEGQVATAIAPDSDASTARPALSGLLEATAPDDAIDAIPDGVAIVSLELKKDGIHLDLSEEFTFGGGSATMQGRLAQVLYTATAGDPTAALWLSVAGEPLTALGGLDVPQPLTRKAFEANFSL